MLPDLCPKKWEMRATIRFPLKELESAEQPVVVQQVGSVVRSLISMNRAAVATDGNTCLKGSIMQRGRSAVPDQAHRAG
jgi:hypothetical protein